MRESFATGGFEGGLKDEGFIVEGWRGGGSEIAGGLCNGELGVEGGLESEDHVAMGGGFEARD